MSNVKAFTKLPHRVPCVRCGIPRKDGGNLAALCRDCRGVLTKAEVKMWAA